LKLIAANEVSSGRPLIRMIHSPGRWRGSRSSWQPSDYGTQALSAASREQPGAKPPSSRSRARASSATDWRWGRQLRSSIGHPPHGDNHPLPSRNTAHRHRGIFERAQSRSTAAPTKSSAISSPRRLRVFRGREIDLSFSDEQVLLRDSITST
jgi:hypothetical protein